MGLPAISLIIPAWNEAEFLPATLQAGGYVGGSAGLVMERGSPGIAAVWYTVMPPLWLMGYDGGVMFCRRNDFVQLGGYREGLLAAEDVEFMSRLRALGRKSRPRERFATRFTARRLGPAPSLAVNSCRKFDQHGEWHLCLGGRGRLPARSSRSPVRARIGAYGSSSHGLAV